jgi:hypothetical protein
MSERILTADSKQISTWDTIERAARTLSIVAIPVVLAVGGWVIQKRLADQTVSRDYVQLAVSILKEPEGSNIKPEMRIWAVQLLNDNSPTKFNAQVAEQLQSGKVQLPESFTLAPTGPVITSTTDKPKGRAEDWESKGFDFIVNKDVDSALDAFSNAEELRPSYHNVSEIRKLLQERRSSLAAAPKDGPSEVWTQLYRELTTKYSWGMPAEIKRKMSEQ